MSLEGLELDELTGFELLEAGLLDELSGFELLELDCKLLETAELDVEPEELSTLSEEELSEFSDEEELPDVEATEDDVLELLDELNELEDDELSVILSGSEPCSELLPFLLHPDNINADANTTDKIVDFFIVSS